MRRRVWKHLCVKPRDISDETSGHFLAVFAPSESPVTGIKCFLWTTDMFLLMSATRVSSHSHYMFVTERWYQEVDGRRGLCFSVCTCELAGCLLETFSSRVCGDRTWCFSRWRVFTYLRYNRLCELLIIFHLFISGWCSLQPQRASDGRHLYLSSYSEDFVLIKDVNNVWTGYSKSPATSVVREKTVQWTMKLPSSLFCLVLIFHISTRVNLS